MSQEIENKFRFENTYRKNGWKLNFGTGIEHATYTNSTYQRIVIQNQLDTLNFSSKLNIIKTSLFGQLSRQFLSDKLIFSVGLRTDQNNYSESMNNPLEQISPRLSISYSINKKSSINFNAGRYFQLPAYTVMGYRNNNNELVNKENNLKYINNNHLVLGLEYNPGTCLLYTSPSPRDFG